MVFTVDVRVARTAFAESVSAFLAAVDGLTEYELLDRSRCYGWTRLDVVSHVLNGWLEMLGGMACPVDDEPTVDAASYWTAFATDHPADDPVASLLAQRRRTDAYSRPASAVIHLTAVAATLQQAAAILPDRPCAFQGYVLSAGDFLATWAVENAVHHLDLNLDDQPPTGALSLARNTVEALVGELLPPDWSDVDAVLAGTGRSPALAGSTHLANQLPAFG